MIIKSENIDHFFCSLGSFFLNSSTRFDTFSKGYTLNIANKK